MEYIDGFLDAKRGIAVTYLITKALQKFEKEKHIVEELLAGRTTLDIYGFDKLLDRLL